MSHICPTADVREPRRLEEAARQIVEHSLDLKLIYADDNGGVDFCLVEDGAHLGILEVTRQTDEDWRRLAIQLNESETTFRAEIEGHWYLEIDRRSGPRQVADRLDQISRKLRGLEANDVDHFPHHGHGARDLDDDLLPLGLASGYRLKSEDTGRIDLTFGGISWWTGNEHIQDAISLAVSENQHKLRPGPGERHLFLWIEFYDLPAFEQLRSGEMPTEPPDLNDLADTVWIAPADPLKDQDSIPIWLNRSGDWRAMRIEIPDQLYL